MGPIEDVLRGGLSLAEWEKRRAIDTGLAAKEDARLAKAAYRKANRPARVSPFEVYGYAYVGREYHVVVNGNIWQIIGVFISDDGAWEYWEMLDGRAAMPAGDRVMRGKTVWWRYVATI